MHLPCWVGLAMWAGKGGWDYVTGEREAQLFTLGLYFLIVAKLHVNKVFVSSRCPSSFLSPAGAWPGAGGQGVEWWSGQREEGKGCGEEGLSSGSSGFIPSARMHLAPTLCRHQANARDTAVHQAGMVLPSWSSAWWETEGRWDTATRRGACGAQGES